MSPDRNPTGFITKPATVLGTKPAPFMAAFSSQGPNTITPEILKVETDRSILNEALLRRRTA